MRLLVFLASLFSTFFRLGQTLETFRGKGVDQRAVDVAIEKLDRGNWVRSYFYAFRRSGTNEHLGPSLL